MRLALAMVLIVTATMAWADEPRAPDAKTEATPAAAQEAPVEQVPATEQTTEQTTEQATEQATEAATEAAAEESAEQATAETTTADADKPFKVPAGYRSKTVNGKQMYCSSNTTLGSRFAKEKCRTEAQLRKMEAKAPPPDQSNPTCSGGGCASK